MCSDLTHIHIYIHLQISILTFTFVNTYYLSACSHLTQLVTYYILLYKIFNISPIHIMTLIHIFHMFNFTLTLKTFT